MTPRLHPDLLEMLDAAAIPAPDRYTLLGRTRVVADSGDGRALCEGLQGDLYEHLYCRPTDPFNLPPCDEPARRDHLAACSAANSGTGTWEAGWTIRQVEPDGRVAVVKYGLTFWADPTGVRTATARPLPGEPCRVRIKKELRNLSPGYYVAIGDADDDDALPVRAPSPSTDSGPLPHPDEVGRRSEAPFQPDFVRYYWHLTAAAAPPFLAALTGRLNAEAISFRVKVLTNPADYRRADAGILYLARRDHARAGPAIAAVHEAIAAGLRPAVPFFTRRAAPGLGLAEDPGGALSFGEDRCLLVARALWRSFTRGDSTREARSETLAMTFLEAGLDPTRPHLGPGSPDDLGPADSPR